MSRQYPPRKKYTFHNGKPSWVKTNLTRDALKKFRRSSITGYPWEGQFSTNKEVEEYLERDKVVCLICGKERVAIGHHIRVHDISPRDYRIRFGIPLTYRLCGVSHSAQQVATMAIRMEDPEWLEKMRARAQIARDNQPPRKGTKRTWAPCIREILYERLKDHKPREIIKITVSCDVCGKELLRDKSLAKNPPQGFKCPPCKKAIYKKQIELDPTKKAHYQEKIKEYNAKRSEYKKEWKRKNKVSLLVEGDTHDPR